ncbi:beta-1,6-galactofuranosyltransferase [Limosilactobacillus mucosae]|uniref:beta-1,6-galactofuranosyltransferase n=1 Tax=Limosilactobacillus mucosae TaxID=97478 RepID=UPI00233EE2BA|nr:beta-1,6-galactofuranosyltransferase [Limosilactobacillus mucosae]MDC2838392.1 beta-1,6-galactofuranosyltransferase [Limosilactobacillus mucosae]
MTVYITNMHGQMKNSTAQIAQNMAAQFADEIGIRELGYYFYNASAEPEGELSARLDGILSSLTVDDIVILQEPTWMEMPWQQRLVDKINAYRQKYRVKLIMFVHDVAPLMFDNPARVPEWIDFYNQADVLILPMPQMKKELDKWGLKVKKIVYQQAWDAVATDRLTGESPYRTVLNFAGSPSKFTFVNDWHEKVPLEVFADPANPLNNPQVRFQGYVANEHLVECLHQNGGFGLLWEASPAVYEYMKLNVNFKFGSYLAAGLPIVIHRGIAQADLVEKYHLGKVVDSLAEASEWVQSVTEEQYRQMADHVYQFGWLNRQGMFTKRALTEAVFLARLEE